MTPLADFANKIASRSPSSRASRILQALRAHGFQATTEGLNQILAVSASLAPHFRNLEKHFPNTKIVLGNFLLADEILKLLEEQPVPGKEESSRKSKTHAPFCAVIADKEFQVIDFGKHPRIGELFAFFWLAHTCIHAAPGAVVQPKLAELLYASLSVVRSIWMVIEDNPEFCKSWEISLEGDLNEWIAEATKAIDQASASNLALSISALEIKEGFGEALELIRNLESPASSSHDETDGDHEDEAPEIRVSIQRGVGLNERERLTCHYNAFQESEMESLAQNVRNIIERDFSSQHLTLAQICAFPPYYIEASLIALAIATGRSIEGVIQFPLSHESKEYIGNELVSENPKFNYPIWHRIHSSDCHLRIPLPAFLKEPIAQLSGYRSAEIIEDCLPYSVLGWDERCTNWLAKNVSGTRRYINRRVRDALAREIYRSTASPALLRAIASPISDKHLFNESMSRYVNLLDERTLKAYENACQKMFKKYGAPRNLCQLFSNNDFAVSQARHRQVSEFFLGKIEAAGQAGDYIEYHNWVARYLLMLLVVATGHRKSRTPFFFSWDIIAEDNLAFLCDKITTGSEARFAPIPEWVSSLVRDYRRHLLTLSKRLRQSSPQLSAQIELLANGGDLRALRAVQKVPGNDLHTQKTDFGFFFKLTHKLEARTLSTADLEKSYSSAYSGKIGEFRKAAANSLWSGGYSGYQVETFLGHNGDMHSIGESSAWSVTGWADEIRPWQEKYLAAGGWKPIRLGLSAVARQKSGAREVPLLNAGCDSYEGRHRDKQQAMATAIKVIRENLPAIWFLDEESSITDEDVRELKALIESRLLGDPEACKQVNLALAREIERIRKCVGKVSSTIANLTKIEPCPIPVHASRHYAIASEIRVWWASEVGKYPAGVGGATDRLAEIGISLVIFDALLDLVTWKNIIEEIARHDTRKCHGCLIARARIERRDRAYDKSLTLSPATSALLLGFEEKYSSAILPETVARDVIRRANKLLQSAPAAISSESIGLANLIDVFKSWWLVRLPGALYSIAVGEHSGPAADALSECAMYEIPCGMVARHSRLTVLCTGKHAAKAGPERAHHLFNKFLNYAGGEFENKVASTRYQRQRLSGALRNLEASGQPALSDLSALSQNQQIVFLMLEFLMFLLEEGGKRKEALRFSAIRTYFSNIRKLIDVLWDKDILGFEAKDYDEAYREVVARSDVRSADLGTPLYYFHKLMRMAYGAPPSVVADTFERAEIQCRASVITARQFEDAWSQVGEHAKDDGQIIHHLKSYLYLVYNHGVRPKEAFGIRAKHVVAKNPCAIRIARNAARDLKTDNALRTTRSMLATSAQEKHFNSVVDLALRSPAANSYLFDDAEQFNRLYSTWRIGGAATSVLRSVTGNPWVVPYSMRHSAATRLAHWAFVPPRVIPLSAHIENSMKGSLKEESIFECFEHGFTAWPFWLDRVGMHLGQAGSDTLLDTYWHTSSLRLAEHTWRAMEKVTFTDAQLANMLGRERSAITHQRKRLQPETEPDPAGINIHERLVIHCANKSGIPSVGKDFDETLPLKPVKLRSDNSGTEDVARWVAYDRLLCMRLDQKLSFDQTIKLAPGLSLNAKATRKFIDTYKDIVRLTGFADFEPDNSEILYGKAKRSVGVIRGAIERERGLTAAHRLANTAEGFSQTLNEFTGIWISRVDCQNPWLVARDEKEFHLIIGVLSKLGVRETQLEFCYCNFEMSRIRKLLTKKQLDSAVTQERRLSKGPKDIRESEIGIRVVQESNSIIGDNRDTHRLALMLAAISRADCS